MGVAQDSPTRDWLGGWVDFFQTVGALILVVVIMGMGLWILVRATIRLTVRTDDGKVSHWVRPGGVRAAIAFGLGAALVLWLLTNVDNVAEFLRGELPIGGGQ